MILKVPEDVACEVWDANGVRLEWCQWCDTETGEAVHVRVVDGVMQSSVSEDGELVAATEWRQHPAPLTFKRHQRACG